MDWSDLTQDQRWQLLRASVVIKGRAVTLYEEVHPQTLLDNTLAHKRFLQRLANLIPQDGRLIVMTDANYPHWA